MSEPKQIDFFYSDPIIGFAIVAVHEGNHYVRAVSAKLKNLENVNDMKRIMEKTIAEGKASLTNDIETKMDKEGGLL